MCLEVEVARKWQPGRGRQGFFTVARAIDGVKVSRRPRAAMPSLIPVICDLDSTFDVGNARNFAISPATPPSAHRQFA